MNFLKKLLYPLLILTIIFNIISIILIFFFAPREVNMGDAQKIFYYHVPMAINSYFLILISSIGALGFLIKRTAIYALTLSASLEISIIFLLCVLISGSVWGKAVWGKWWIWEPRLTTFLILFLIFLSAYLFFIFSEKSKKTYTLLSIITLLGAVDVPFVHKAISLWGSIVHPEKIILEKEMKMILFFSFLSISLLALTLLIFRFHIGFLRKEDAIFSKD